MKIFVKKNNCDFQRYVKWLQHKKKNDLTFFYGIIVSFKKINESNRSCINKSVYIFTYNFNLFPEFILSLGKWFFFQTFFIIFF